MLDKIRPGNVAVRIGMLLVGLFLVGAIGWWAGRATLSEARLGAPEAPEALWATATQSSVGRSLPLSTTVKQPSRPIAVNGLTGIVTEVNPGQRNQGEVAYIVGDVPVRVVQASRPFHRALSNGIAGEDVKALQSFLASSGYFAGEADGSFGQSTVQAVQAWQKAESRPQTGSVELGELVGVPTLPISVTLGENIRVGNRLSGGEDGVLAPTGERRFVLIVNPSQAELIPQDSTVEITFESLQWRASISEARLTPDNETEFTLVGADGAPVCGEECGQLPAAEELVLRSQVVVVPPIEGVAVPAAAVTTRPDGTTFVETEQGPAEVTVRGSGQGIVIVDGIPEGTRVRLTGESGR